MSREDDRYVASDGSWWRIYATCPPIPTRAFDWDWCAEDYGGPGDNRHGSAPTRDDAILGIEEFIAENAS